MQTGLRSSLTSPAVTALDGQRQRMDPAHDHGRPGAGPLPGAVGCHGATARCNRAAARSGSGAGVRLATSGGRPRELSEIAELRLWSLRADAACPWLPLVLERSGGQLARHVAMLLPHQFNRSEGIRFAPESLELWITHRLFVLDDWARAGGLNCRQNLGQMAAVLGFELDPGFWERLS